MRADRTAHTPATFGLDPRRHRHVHTEILSPDISGNRKIFLRFASAVFAPSAASR